MARLHVGAAETQRPGAEIEQPPLFQRATPLASYVTGEINRGMGGNNYEWVNTPPPKGKIFGNKTLQKFLNSNGFIWELLGISNQQLRYQPPLYA